MLPILLDTSIWVRYLRSRGAESLGTAVREALNAGQVATCWVVKAELLVGARDSAAFAQLLEALGGATDVTLSPEVWVEAARLGQQLRKLGILVPLPDLLIAQCAISSQRVLWHTDALFEQIRERSSLQTRRWPPDS